MALAIIPAPERSRIGASTVRKEVCRTLSGQTPDPTGSITPMRLHLLLVTTALALAGCSSGVVFDPAVPTRGTVLNERAAAAAINQYRAQHGLGPVVLDPGLTRAASYAASSNAKLGSLSHDAGGSFDARMTRFGFARGGIAENLGAGSATFEQQFVRWQASAAHNSNLLLPHVTRVGIARADAPGSTYGRFWAMEFGR